MGEERWNVRWEGSCWRTRSIVLPSFSVKTIFELFLFFLSAFRRVTPRFRLSFRAVASPPRPFHELLCSLSPTTTPLVVHSPPARFSKGPASVSFGGRALGWRGPKNCRSRDLCPDRSPNRGRGRPSVHPIISV